MIDAYQWHEQASEAAVEAQRRFLRQSHSLATAQGADIGNFANQLVADARSALRSIHERLERGEGRTATDHSPTEPSRGKEREDSSEPGSGS